MNGTLNKVMLIGHTGTEVKMHYFEGGGSIGDFSLATNESYTNRTTGEKVINTEWHNVVVRNKAAEICEKYLKKGDKVYIEGRLKTKKWQDAEGKDRYTTEIHCTDFNFLTPKSDTGNTIAQNPATTTPEETKETQKTPDSTGDKSSDLPF